MVYCPGPAETVHTVGCVFGLTGFGPAMDDIVYLAGPCLIGKATAQARFNHFQPLKSLVVEDVPILPCHEFVLQQSLTGLYSISLQ